MDIYTRQVNCEHWPVDSPRGWNAGLTDLGRMCGGGRGEVKVASVEARGQLDAGWLPSCYKPIFYLKPDGSTQKAPI